MREVRERLPARPIRSYVLRAGRITAAQARALEQWWPKYGVDYQPCALDLTQLYGRSAPVTLEIGFGNGEHLVRRAAREPERNFLGIEVHRPGIGHLLLAATHSGINNLRVIAHDAVEVLEYQIAPASLDEALLLFPDPWPKKRHHKRRLVQQPFIALLASRLRCGGRVHIATDWTPYAEQMLIDLKACPGLVQCQETVSTEPQLYGAAAAERAHEPNSSTVDERTRFERRGERMGHRIHRLLFERVDPD
jgi:tRNA (guanine-N7-)-methyltransferase